MARRSFTPEELQELRHLASQWGKIVARRAYGDQGPGLDASNIPDPLAPENLMKTSGRGIFLIRSFMDVVEIHPSQSGTEFKMIKHVRGSATDSKEASQ